MQDNVREIFQIQLKMYMNQQQKKQSDLAAELNVPLTTVAGWYHGKNFPRPDKMQKIAECLQVRVEDLITQPHESELTFKNAREAIEFILKQPMVANFGGYDLEKMTDEEIIEFANDVSGMIEILGKKYIKKT